jgi:hypothetical protein
MTLFEVAAALGVETHTSHPTMHQMDPIGTVYKRPRPTLDIAHDCLAKLPDNYQVEWLERDRWYWKEYRGCCDACLQPITEMEHGTFGEAVLALAERFLKEKKEPTS